MLFYSNVNLSDKVDEGQKEKFNLILKLFKQDEPQ